MDGASAVGHFGARSGHCLRHCRARESYSQRIDARSADLDDNIGIVEKGRLIEIEALYVSLCALAIIFWLSFWEQKKSAWLTWTVPFVFLGLGWLAKGPVHLLFFYGVVVAVIWKQRKLRALLHPAHF